MKYWILLISTIVLMPYMAKGSKTDDSFATRDANSVTAQNVSRIYNVEDYGALGDGRTDNTTAINKAIEACAAAGGGTVLFSDGTYMSGLIRMQNNITLEVSESAVLAAMANGTYLDKEGPWEYQYSWIIGHELENVAITGKGVIEGKYGLTRDGTPGWGMHIIHWGDSRNVKLTEITFRHGGRGAIRLYGVENFEIANIRLENFWDLDPDGGGTGRDGIDFTAARHGHIRDSYIAGSDDALCFKSYNEGYMAVPTEDILVERCTITSRSCSAIQFGSQTGAPFRNMTFRDITIEHAGKAGIGITMNDGSVIEDITFRDIRIKNSCAPIYMAVTDRMGIGVIRNILFENIVFDPIGQNREYSNRSPHGFWTATLMGLKERPVENIVFRSVKLAYPGGVTQSVDRTLPPDPPGDYQPRRIGMRPASGFYIRHAKGIEFYNLEVTTDESDARPALVFDDVDEVVIEAAQLPNDSQASCNVLARGSTNIKIAENPGVMLKEASLPAFPAPGAEQKSASKSAATSTARITIALADLPSPVLAAIEHELGKDASVNGVAKKLREGREVFEVDANLDGGGKVELNFYEDGTLRSRR